LYKIKIGLIFFSVLALKGKRRCFIEGITPQIIIWFSSFDSSTPEIVALSKEFILP
jgi:hypothetical protein